MSEAPARVGVLGGTFDPIHEAHLLVAHAVRDSLLLDQVIFMPAGDPWRKAGAAITPAQHRLAAVRAAVEAAADPTFVVSDAEVRRPGPTYTVDTFRELQSNGRSLWFILGADALLDLPHWHAPAEFVRLARLALLQQFAHADNRLEARGQGGHGFLVHFGIRLAQNVSPFAVSQNDVGRTDVA